LVLILGDAMIFMPALYIQSIRQTKLFPIHNKKPAEAELL